MRVTRITQYPHAKNDGLKVQKRPYRKAKRYVKESSIKKLTDITEPLNTPGTFTYADINRNSGMISLLKHQMQQAVSNYGVDLTYFRKFNTFFKEGEENHSNLIYRRRHYC